VDRVKPFVQVPTPPSAPDRTMARSRCATSATPVRPLGAVTGTRLSNGSRMRREPHVRFCERAGVQLPCATHLIAGFEHEDDARRFLDMMRARFEEFALSLHPDKTRLIEFGRYAAARRERRGLGKPETFNFLGFTFICGKTRNGGFLLHRKSRGDRMRAKLQEVQEELRQRRHQAIPRQGKWLRQSLPRRRPGSSAATSTTMQCRPTVAPSRSSITTSAGFGCVRSSGVAKRTARRGSG
jgi:hypothetical protein